MTTRRRKRKINVKALVYAAAGPEPKHVVYEFGRDRKKLERPKHNPFAGL